MIDRLVSLFGVFVMMALAFAMCPAERRRAVQLRPVLVGLALLFGFGILVLHTPVRQLFSWATAVVDGLLAFTAKGSEFVFGSLATADSSVGFVFAVQVLPTILFFSAVMAVLYHIGVMPAVIRAMARVLSRVLGTSGAETFSTVADIFVGQTEAPLAIRPYVARLTNAELMACMVAGFATTAGGVLAAYVKMLRDLVPDIAGHLLACSVMCAPAALVIAKLILPEVDKPETLGRDLPRTPSEHANLLDALAAGATDGVKLAVNVAAMLIVFLAFTAMANSALGAVSGWFGGALTLEQVLGWLFAPLAWVMGVPSQDVLKVGSLLGQKTVLNEFVAYKAMTETLHQDPSWLLPRSRLIASYALCGFANFGSIGIQIGGYSGLAPDRRADLSRIALRAMVGGMLTTCMVACVAGVLV